MSPGSSPLARGLRNGASLDYQRRRIIPARAGFTHERASPPRYSQDHPRSRGVYGLIRVKARLVPGSSPLARGLPRLGHACDFEARIIPARAGFTFEEYSFQYRAGDHPRSRGVYANIDVEALAAAGSSPLARGLHGVCRGPGERHRIIPARAGFTFLRAGTAVPRRDHPRSRGVYPFEDQFDRKLPGSSPLARGLQVSDFILIGQNRIIPARAGFTNVCSIF